jgi:hypothetical protein
MASGQRTRGRIRPPSPEEVDKAVAACVERVSTKKDAPYFRGLLLGLVHNHSVPIELLEHIPVPSRDCGKTRFDQLFDAAMHLAFPGYRRETLERLLGPLEGKGTRIWRVLIPERFQVAQVLIRADTFPQAFALACDYVCRVSVRLYQKVPVDLTVRVMFMGERALRRYLSMRWASRTNKRKQLKLVGREFTYRQVNGARLAALGHPKDPSHSIVKYAEMKDLQRIREAKGLARVSSVEAESPKKA